MPVAEMSPSVRVRRVATVDSASSTVNELIPTKGSPKLSLESLFASRASLLDLKQLAPELPQSTNLTGFYHFYWILLSFFVSSTLFVNWFERGYLLQGTVKKLFFSDPFGVIAGEVFFLALALLSGLSVFCGPGLKFARSFFPASSFALGTLFGFYRKWSGLQRSIFLLHSLSVFMKIHAFLHHHRGQCVPLSKLRQKMSHFMYFLFCPTMVYSENYPGTIKIRKSIVLERILGILLCGISMYMVVEIYILPSIQRLVDLPFDAFEASFYLEIVYAYSKLLLPCSAFFLLGFFFVFEYWCNLFAELTCFADRQFYTEWWNGASFYDFSTRWNVPVHKFLQHYVYRHCIAEYRTSKELARLITFLISSIFHELVMFVLMGPSKYSFSFLFVFQMLQIPLISLVVGSGWAMNHKALANWVFWIMLVLGLPTVVVSYSLFSN